MQSHGSLKNLCFVAIISSVAVFVLGETFCNKCQSTDVKCLNETHFSLCTESVAPDQVISCPDGQICTGLKKICMPRGSTEPSCPTDADVTCPSCNGSTLFVCTSRTTFQMCNGDKLTSQVTKCKDNTYCAISGKKFCVDRCEALKSGIQCNRESPLEL
ncbi:uncharacterized protein LOC108028149 [Drosophila biarmipes]|uniref:uncharacterized protein LOC108028149 n=1 Tax=Drosophila biarmipes TaxID=125945 RepID=UPI0007E74ABB|nr:uncharacterized protein LOC108028149 [Drosophila biarmipes]